MSRKIDFTHGLVGGIIDYGEPGPILLLAFGVTLLFLMAFGD